MKQAQWRVASLTVRRCRLDVCAPSMRKRCQTKPCRSLGCLPGGMFWPATVLRSCAHLGSGFRTNTALHATHVMPQPSFAKATWSECKTRAWDTGSSSNGSKQGSLSLPCTMATLSDRNAHQLVPIMPTNKAFIERVAGSGLNNASASALSCKTCRDCCTVKVGFPPQRSSSGRSISLRQALRALGRTPASPTLAAHVDRQPETYNLNVQRRHCHQASCTAGLHMEK